MMLGSGSTSIQKRRHASVFSYPIDDADYVRRLRRSFLSGKTRPEKWRRSQLEALQRWIYDYEDEIIEALMMGIIFDKNSRIR